MFTGRSLTDLAKELERQAKSKKDFKAPTSQIEMSFGQITTKNEFSRHDLLVPQLQLNIGDKFKGVVTELCHDQLGQYVDIPSKYYDRMRMETPELLAQNVNTWLKRRKETRLVRTLDGDARAFLSNRYRTIDHWDVANATLPVLVNEAKKLGSVETVSADVTEKKLYIKVISKRLTYEVKKGDAVQAGIVISNSEVGGGSVRVEPFLYRLACLNGAVISDSAVRKFHIGRLSAELEAAEEVYRDETRVQDDKAFCMKLQDVVRASFDDDSFEKLRGIVIDSTTREVSSPVEEVIEEISNRFHLTDKQRGSFLGNLIKGGDMSQWGIANAVTAIANKASNYEEATDLERIGGQLMTLDSEGWENLMEATAA